MTVDPNSLNMGAVIAPLLIPYPHFNPVALQLGPLAVHWYGLMYLLGFWFEWWLLNFLNRKRQLGFAEGELSDLLGNLILGVVLGGRLGYVLFYNPVEYFHHPFEIIAVWHGGMSFHGGLIGTLLAGWLWCRRKGVSFLDLADVAIVGVPIGLALGRFGNFINGELWGKPAINVPWAMVFPGAIGDDRSLLATHPAWISIFNQYGGLPRHPSELYELALEGVFLFTLLVILYMKRAPRGTVMGAFIGGYGCIRFFVEFFRQADPQFITATNPNGSVLGTPFHMGQILSLPMIAIGLGIVIWAVTRPKEKRVSRLGAQNAALAAVASSIGCADGQLENAPAPGDASIPPQDAET